MIRCTLEHKLTECLWDTGAMVSLLSESWIKRNLPKVEIKEVSELLDEYPGLDLTAANGSRIPFSGWAEVNLELAGGILLRVPFLVTKGELEQPLVGYNVVETIINEYPESNIILAMFPGLETEGATQLIDAIQTKPKEVAQVSTAKEGFQLVAGETVNIRCKADAGHFDRPTPMVFEPDEQQSWPVGLAISESLITIPAGVTTRVKIPITNETKHTITVGGKLHIGRLTAVLSITPLPVNLVTSQVVEQMKQAPESKKEHSNTPTSLYQPREEYLERIISAIDMKSLTEEQQIKAKQMLTDEWKSFSMDDKDIGHIQEHMRIELSDQTPVQKRYNTIPKPLFPEIKAYIEDLLNRNWIRQSNSNYSSPIVAVRRKKMVN